MKLTLWLALFSALGSSLLSGCANVTTGGPLMNIPDQPENLCIIRNPDVTFERGLSYLQRSFQVRGIDNYVVDSAAECYPDNHWQLDYSIRRSWIVMRYIGSMHLILRKDKRVVSEVEYDAGELSLDKWGNADKKIDGAVRALLGH